MTEPPAIWPQDNALAEAASLTALAELLRGHNYLADLAGRRLRVADGPDSRAVEIECHTRPGDGGRLWFTWGGGIWMCEADRPTDALVQVKTALRRILP
jgi:hypothetical protein